jgi:hypothetical protein
VRGRVCGTATAILEMAADKDELRTEFARLPSRHATADSEGLSFVRSRKHDPAADGDASTSNGNGIFFVFSGSCLGAISNWPDWHR